MDTLMEKQALTTSQRFDAPEQKQWWQSAVFYEVYIRSFKDSNGDGIGDLRGIEQQLPYLKQLGVDALWITPFYASPMTDFGYDVSDYQAVDPIFGKMADFDQLLKTAHELGLRVVIDFVPNHTSNQHVWFNEARRSPDHPKRDWYIWRDAKPDGSPPNNWVTFFGGSAWTWDEPTSQYYLHLFLNSQPDLNWRNPEVIWAMEACMKFWLQKGVDGFRLDAINFLIKHADFPDMPLVPVALGADLVDYHIYVNNQPELHVVLKRLRAVMDSFAGDRVLIGETGTLKPAALSQFYGENLDEIHLPMIVLPLHSAWAAQAMRETLISFYAGLPVGATPHFVFGNHDDKRLISRYGYEHHRSIALLLLTLRGAPILYYGDEIAMTDAFIPREKRRDTPSLNAPEENAGRDPVRTPMQWTADANVGFTAEGVETWLPVHSNHTTVNVQAQEQDPRSTLHFYQDLLAIRRQSSALLGGSIGFLDDLGTDILAYLRESADERCLVLINFGGNAHRLDLSAVADQAVCLLNSAMQPYAVDSIAEVSLLPYQSLLLKLN